jgi:hypothetical protein
MNIIKFISIICVLILFIFGCSFLTPPKEKPVIQDQVGPLFKEKTTHVFSLTPERRTVIIAPTKKPLQHDDGEPIILKDKDGNERLDKETVIRFCAEPPPDVAESLADTFRFLAEAQLEKADVKVGTEFYKAFTSSAMSLFYRSQGIQLFRDGLFNLCQAQLNGLIKDQQYIKKYEDLLNKSSKLIKQEIDKMEITRGIEYEKEVQKAIKAKDDAIGAKNEVEIIKQIVETDMNNFYKYKDSIDSTTNDIKNNIKELNKRVEQLEKK